jgi:hypothetical protein
MKTDQIDFLEPSLHNNLWQLPHEPFADLPDEKFHEMSVKLKMPKMFFSQLPLLVGYAITAHRIQGMTLESLKADCNNLFEEAMFYVIASRVRKYQDFSFENFSPDCIKTSAAAVEFYERLGNGNNNSKTTAATTSSLKSKSSSSSSSSKSTSSSLQSTASLQGLLNFDMSPAIAPASGSVAPKVATLQGLLNFDMPPQNASVKQNNKREREESNIIVETNKKPKLESTAILSSNLISF